MYIYIFNLFFVFLMLIISRMFYFQKKTTLLIGNKSIHNYKSSLFILISFFSIFLISGLRYNVGTDYQEYVNLFYSISNTKIIVLDHTAIEPLFIVFIKIVSIFSNNPVWLFLAFSFFITYFIYKASIKSSNLYDLAIFLFLVLGFYTSSLNIVRQWMAASVLLFGYSFLENENSEKNKFWWYVLLAFLCHYSSLIVIPIYFFIHKPRTNKIRIFFILLSIVIFNSTNFIIEILQYISLNIGVFNKYYKYLKMDENIGGSIFVLPMFCLLTYLFYFIINRNSISSSKSIEININILIIGFAFSLIGQKLMIFNRLQFFFVSVLIIVIPQLVSLVRKKERAFVYLFFIVLGTIFLIYSLSNNGGNPLPYQTIFS